MEDKVKLGWPMKLEITQYTAIFDTGEEFDLIKCDGPNSWKISDWCGFTLNSDLEWEYESLPSNRSEVYLYTNRFPLTDAKEILLKWYAKNYHED